MTGENFLLTLSRIAITFVGFASIVSLLRHAGRDWLPNEIRGMKLMFEFDLAAMFFALLPFPLFYTIGDQGEQVVWRIAASLLACYLTYALWFQSRSHRRAAPKSRHPNVFRWLFVAPTCTVLVVEIATSVFWPSIAGYAWGLFWLLIPPVVQFSIFIAHFGTPLTTEEQGQTN